MRWKIFQWMKFLFRHPSNLRKLSRQKFHNELQGTRVRIHCSLRKQKCRLKSTTTNGWRHFGQSGRRKSSVLFPIQSEKSPDSGFFTCDPTNKCIMPSSRERHKGIIGRGHDLRLPHGPRTCHGSPGAGRISRSEGSNRVKQIALGPARPSWG